MKLRAALSSFVLTALVATPVAQAHVTLNPREWEAGGFARFAIRVPNERDNGATTKVTVQFPESVVSARFMPEPGWKRTIKMARLDEPIEEEGEEPITERIASVTWSGGRIEPNEFVEFGVSFQVPDTPGEDLVFPAVQTYSNGEVVRWIAPDPEAETPAPRVAVLPPEEEEGQAQATAEAAAAPEEGGGGGGGGETRTNVALGLGIAGLVAGLLALGVAIVRTRPS